VPAGSSTGTTVGSSAELITVLKFNRLSRIFIGDYVLVPPFYVYEANLLAKSLKVTPIKNTIFVNIVSGKVLK
jgi:hypothetical protein